MIKLFKADVSVDTTYRKTLRLGESEEDTNCVYITLNELEEDYESYIKNILEYFRGNANLKELLDVDSVVPMGYYIRGIFGGEKKKGKESYAGLVFEVIGYDSVKDVYVIRLHNVNTDLEIPASELKEYWFKLIYRGEVHPFYLEKVYNVVLSKSGKSNLIRFLQKVIQLNKSKLNPVEKNMIDTLINEVQQPSRVSPLNKEKYYVIYRGKRTFSSVMIDKISDKTIAKDEVGYLETSSKDLALYYSAILNYLAYKSIQAKLAFNRDQYERPLHVIVEAGLSWRDTTEIRKVVAKLSEQLHEEVKTVFKGQSFSQERQYFKVLEKNPKFNKLVKILDDQISSTIGLDELIEILSHWVAGKS